MNRKEPFSPELSRAVNIIIDYGLHSVSGKSFETGLDLLVEGPINGDGDELGNWEDDPVLVKPMIVAICVGYLLKFARPGPNNSDNVLIDACARYILSQGAYVSTHGQYDHGQFDEDFFVDAMRERDNQFRSYKQLKKEPLGL